MNHSLYSGSGIVPEMDDVQFSRWQSLLEERTGMCLPVQRRSFLQTSLGLRMQEVGCESYQEYYDRVLSGPAGAIEWNTLVDRLTVQETRFFRDPDAFAFAEQHMRQLHRSLPVNSAFEAWSVGCSSGEEAYSVAMLAQEIFAADNRSFAVTGTDISTIVLRKARAGRYMSRSLQWLPEFCRDSGMLALDNGHIQISDSLRKSCCFSQVNILNLDACPLEEQHLIYCQNVLIYFRRWRRREILNALAQRLAPGGVLIIGLGEMVDWQHPLLEPVRSSRVSAFIRKSENSTGETARR